MNLKNYTSTVNAPVSMAKIEECLVEIGAHNINKKYENKMCVAISFLYLDERLKTTIAFNIEAKTDAAFKILWKEVKRPQADTEQRIREQANRTAWKIVSDWVEIQCAMILLGQATPLQMFLPMVYDPAKNETLYDKVMNGSLQLQIGQPQ